MGIIVHDNFTVVKKKHKNTYLACWYECTETIALFHFWIYIYLYQMVLSRLKFMINEMILIFDIVNFPFLDGDVPRSTSNGVYIFSWHQRWPWQTWRRGQNVNVLH